MMMKMTEVSVSTPGLMDSAAEQPSSILINFLHNSRETPPAG